MKQNYDFDIEKIKNLSQEEKVFRKKNLENSAILGSNNDSRYSFVESLPSRNSIASMLRWVRGSAAPGVGRSDYGAPRRRASAAAAPRPRAAR